MDYSVYKRQKADIETFYHSQLSRKEAQSGKYAFTFDFTNKIRNMEEKWNVLVIDIEQFVLNHNLSTKTVLIIPNYNNIANVLNRFVSYKFMSNVILEFLFGDIETLSTCFNKNQNEIKDFMCSMSLIIIDIQMIQLSNENHWFGLPHSFQHLNINHSNFISSNYSIQNHNSLWTIQWQSQLLSQHLNESIATICYKIHEHFPQMCQLWKYELPRIEDLIRRGSSVDDIDLIHRSSDLSEYRVRFVKKKKKHWTDSCILM
eukprot:174893_1